MLQLTTTTWKHWQRRKDFHHSYTTEPIHSRKYIQQRTYTSTSHCNEFKLCVYWLLCREPILVSNSLIWEILEYSEEDSQLYTTIRQIIAACMSQQWKQWTFKMIFHQFQLIISKSITYYCLSSMQDAEHCHYPELIGEPLRLELYFSSPLESVTEIIVLGERMSCVAVDKFGVVGRNLWDGTHFP